jgi:hypothetical protein
MATEYKEGNLKIIYRDDIVTVVVPSTLKASIVSCRGTKWCSSDQSGFDTWAKEHILFRFLFKDGYKLRLTWRFKENYKGSTGTWGCGGGKYTEVAFKGDPFHLSKEIEKEIEKEYDEKKKTPFLYNDKEMTDYDFYGNPFKTTNKKYYDEWYNIKKGIIERVKTISAEAAAKVTEYRNKLISELPKEDLLCFVCGEKIKAEDMPDDIPMSINGDVICTDCLKDLKNLYRGRD